jgi:hypothetical protein
MIFCSLLLENIEMYCILSFAKHYELSESRNLTLEKKLSQFKPSKVTSMMIYNYRIQLLRWHNPFLYIFICLIKHDQNFLCKTAYYYVLGGGTHALHGSTSPPPPVTGPPSSPHLNLRGLVFNFIFKKLLLRLFLFFCCGFFFLGRSLL